VTSAHLLGHRDPRMGQPGLRARPAGREAPGGGYPGSEGAGPQIGPDTVFAILLRGKDLGQKMKGPCSWHRLAPRDQLPCPLLYRQYTR
jgi:hypothetical protein